MTNLDHSQMLGNSGPRYYLDVAGLGRYTFSFPSDYSRAWLEQRMKQTELDAIDSEPSFSEATKDRMRARVLRDAKLGAYRVGAERYNEFILTHGGSIAYAQSLLIELQPTITDADVERIMEREPHRVGAILSLIHADACITLAGSKLSAEKKEATLQEIYRRLALPPDAGGYGLPMSEIAKMTDRQKFAMYASDDTDTKSSGMTPAEVSKVDDLLRKHAALNGIG